MAFQHIDIADGFFMGNAFHVWHPWANARGHDHMVKIAQHLGLDARVELQRNVQLLNHFAVIAQRLVKFFIAGH